MHLSHFGSHLSRSRGSEPSGLHALTYSISDLDSNYPLSQVSAVACIENLNYRPITYTQFDGFYKTLLVNKAVTNINDGDYESFYSSSEYFQMSLLVPSESYFGQ